MKAHHIGLGRTSQTLRDKQKPIKRAANTLKAERGQRNE